MTKQVKKLDISRLNQLFSDTDRESLHYKRTILAEVKAHIGHYQCDAIFAIIEDAPCTVCAVAAFKNFGIDGETISIIWPAISGERDWELDKARSEDKHEKLATEMYEAGKEAARQAIATGKLGIEYNGPTANEEDFYRGIKEVADEGSSIANALEELAGTDGIEVMTMEQFFERMDGILGEEKKNTSH